MRKIIHLGIADDHLLLRQGLIALLKEYDNLNVIIDVGNGQELITALKNNKPDVILLDIEMPVMNGKEALEKINIRYPNVKVIMMSMHFNDEYIIEFIKEGACAFLPKNSDIDKIVDAIHSVHENGYYYDDKVSLAMATVIKKAKNRNPDEDYYSLIPDTEFTNREIEVLKLICRKKTNVEIAEALNVSTRTIEGHRYNISKKTNTSNILELIEYAIQNKYIKD